MSVWSAAAIRRATFSMLAARRNQRTLSMKGSLDARGRRNVSEPFLGGRGARPRAERSPRRAQRSTRACGAPLTSPFLSSPVFSSVLTHPCTGVGLVLSNGPSIHSGWR